MVSSADSRMVELRHINRLYIHIYISLEDCAMIPIKMLQKIYWQN